MTTPRDYWRWAVWFGVVSGLGQALIVAIAYFTTNRIVFISPDVVWMAPAANAVVFVVVAAGLRLTTRQLEWPTATGVVLAVFLFLLLLGPFLVVSLLHPYARTILAAGLALQGARMIRSRADLLDLAIRRTLPWLVGLCVALGLGLHLSRSVAERRAEASLAAAAPGAPNVILIVMDTVRAQSLSLYGYARQTSPRLEAFAKTGVVFERALSTAPWTLPSHASLFTGRLPHELSTDWLTPLDAEHPTLAEVFASRGYVTVGFAANVLYTTEVTGLSRGFVRYRDFPVSPGALIYHSWLGRSIIGPFRRLIGDRERFVRKPASAMNDQFVTWIESRPQRPFFAFLNYFDAHGPYVPPPPFDTKFGTAGPVPDIRIERTWSRQEVESLTYAYDGALAYLDEQLGNLLERLKAQGLLDNTLVVVTADHGEQCGEHGLFGHGNSLYRSLLHVPLVISFPSSVPSGLRVSDPVTLVNLPATILDLVSIPNASVIPGRSLAEHWRPLSHPEKAPIFAELSKVINPPASARASKGPMHAVFVAGMHYIRNDDGREELYDFEHDVTESEDLAGRPETSAVIEEARRALAEALKRR